MIEELKVRGIFYKEPEEILEDYGISDHIRLKFWRFFNTYKFGVLEHPLAYIIDPENDKVYMVLAIEDIDGNGTNVIKIVEIT